MIAVQIASDGFVRQLAGFLSQVKQPRRIMAAVGREGRNLLVKHFRQRDRTQSNKLGGRREHFWLQVGRSVQTPLVDASGRAVTIAINDPRMAQKVFGGVIRAKRAKALAIPVDKDSYGRRPSVFEEETGLKLFLVPSDFGRGLLAAHVNGDAGGPVKVFYLLKQSVRQDKDPEALPPRQEMEVSLLRRAESEVARIKSQSGLN